METVKIAGSIVTIGESAFSYCSNLTSVELEDGIATIYEYAFRNCTGIEKIVIPNSVTSIQANAFYLCNNLTIYSTRDSQPDTWVTGWNSSNCKVVWNYNLVGTEGLLYTLSEDGTYYIVSGIENSEATEIIIPIHIDGIVVKEIGSYAFANSNITSIKFSSTITKIGEYAFSGCVSLDEITIPANITTIGAYAFADSGLKNAYFENTDGWSNKIGFKYYYRDANDINTGVKTYNLFVTTKAAEALVGSVKVATGSTWREDMSIGMLYREYSYATMNWHSVEWTCSE